MGPQTTNQFGDSKEAFSRVSYDNGSGIKDGETSSPTMKSEEKEEAIVPSPTKKQKLDEEEEEERNFFKELELEMGPEPEWGFDSYDEKEYIEFPNDRKYFKNDADYKVVNKYRKKLFKGKGFVPDKFNGIFPITNLSIAKHLIDLCIDKYNKETGNTLEYVSTVKGNNRKGPKFTYYMTIMAREALGGSPVEYQVKILEYAGNWKRPVPIFCRRAPPKSKK